MNTENTPFSIDPEEAKQAAENLPENKASQISSAAADATQALRQNLEQASQAVSNKTKELGKLASERSSEFIHSAEERAQQLKQVALERTEQLREGATHLRDQANERLHQGRERADLLRYDAENYVRENPLPTVLGAFGLGLIIGLILKK